MYSVNTVHLYHSLLPLADGRTLPVQEYRHDRVWTTKQECYCQPWRCALLKGGCKSPGESATLVLKTGRVWCEDVAQPNPKRMHPYIITTNRLKHCTRMVHNLNTHMHTYACTHAHTYVHTCACMQTSDVNIIYIAMHLENIYSIWNIRCDIIFYLIINTCTYECNCLHLVLVGYSVTEISWWCQWHCCTLGTYCQDSEPSPTGGLHCQQVFWKWWLNDWQCKSTQCLNRTYVCMYRSTDLSSALTALHLLTSKA